MILENMQQNVRHAIPTQLRAPLGRLKSRFEARWAILTNTTESLVRKRFNDWAIRGRGVSMERGHSIIAQTIWEKMVLLPDDRILDVGCGQGWACRLLAQRAPQGSSLVGIDISNEMIKRAREDNCMHPNVAFSCCRANEIPFPDAYFSKIFSIEAFFYFDDQHEVLKELARVAQPNGELYILICFFAEDPKPGDWFDDIGLPLHNRTIKEYEAMLWSSGWTEVTSKVFDFRESDSSERDAHDMPLLLIAKKQQ